ncbi:zinc finger, SWIM-type [Artemisia annua]|uniref:Zinc finger, SWIM-type n=1 Tax=Artemisia annua TaxID=35608 RepID=A0A2U1KAC2_ARTAN|nr:zinc finger, SWIM-type [Artemisia annua]
MAVNGQPVPLPEAWVDKCYWLETWKEVYSFKIQPCSGRANWKKSPCLTTLTHPHYHPQVGRPKMKRVKGQLEDTPCVKDGKLSTRGRTVRCSSCGNPGHNKQSARVKVVQQLLGLKIQAQEEGEMLKLLVVHLVLQDPARESGFVWMIT